MDVARRRRQAAKGVWAELKENQPAAGIKSFQTCVNAYFLKLWIKYLVRNQNGMWNNVKENKKNKENLIFFHSFFIYWDIKKTKISFW